MKKILVTGAAGFIGFHLCKALMNREIMFLELIILMIIMTRN